MAEYDDLDRNPNADDAAEYDRPRRRPSLAAQRLMLPGMLLILFGVLGLLLETVSLGIAFNNPNALIEFYDETITNMPPGPEKDRARDQFEASKDRLKLDLPINLAWMGGGVFVSLLSLLGGIAMRTQGSYALALLGAISSIIPVGGCCCCVVPVGIWAVIVLADPAVRAVFRSARLVAPEDEF